MACPDVQSAGRILKAPGCLQRCPAPAGLVVCDPSDQSSITEQRAAVTRVYRPGVSGYSIANATPHGWIIRGTGTNGVPEGVRLFVVDPDQPRPR
jgi:hypothetical protein